MNWKLIINKFLVLLLFVVHSKAAAYSKAKWPTLVRKFGRKLRACVRDQRPWQSLLLAQVVNVIRCELGGHGQPS